jgi:hypothetical protein
MPASGPEVDFLAYLGDPDDGAEAIRSKAVLDHIDEHRAKIDSAGYGAIVIVSKGKELIDRRADPILPLVTKFVRTIPYLIDGEAETILLSESEHGFALEPSGDGVLVSFFSGDAYEPEEYLLEQLPIRLEELGEQILSMGERMRDILEAVSPDAFGEDGEGKSLVEFIEMGRTAFKTFKLEVERGLRVQ